MKRTKVVRTIAREARRQTVAWNLEREGADHAVYRLGLTMIPIPRHVDLDDRFVRTRIFKECEAELGKNWWKA